MSTCSDCGGPRTGSSRSYCIECATKRNKVWRKSNPEKYARTRRNGHYLRKYGISLDDYEAMLQLQAGTCAICNTVPDGLLVVDHCHSSGAVRALLCQSCNKGLGLFVENPELLRSAAEYLEDFK